MIPTGNFQWLLIQSPVRLAELAADPTVPDNSVALYSKDKGGTSSLYFKDDADVVHDLGLVPATGQALTKADDTNVTLTLGGSPTVALLAATSLTLGWTGTLAASRGGTGVSALADVTAGSSKISLGGTPTGSVINAFSIDVAEANLDHGAIGGLGDNDHPQYVLASVLTTNGDIFIRNAGAVARLGIGSEGEVLTVASGAPSWEAASGGSGSGASGHLHSLTRLVADGATTLFNLLDIAEYIDSVLDDGVGVDSLDYTLSADGSQVTLGFTPAAGNVLEFNAVAAGI